MILSLRALLPGSLVLVAVLPAAQSVRLSAPLELERAGSVRGGRSELTSDGAIAVFVADRDTSLRLELYSVPTDASADPVRLNDPLPANQYLVDWRVGANDRVVYLVGTPTGGGELFSVPADGSAPPLSLSPPGITYSFLLTREDVRALVRVTPGPPAQASVHVVPIDGGPALALPGTAGLMPRGFSPDGTRVLLEQWDSYFTFGSFHACSADGSAAPILLAHHDQAPPFIEVYLHVEAFSADGQRLLYSVEDYITDGYTFADSQRTLHSVPIDGAAPTQQLSTAPADYLSNVAFDAGLPGGRIAFVDDAELVSMLPDGSARTVLTPPGVTVEPFQRELVVDGAELFFTGLLASGNRTILRVPLDGSAAAIALVPPGPGTVSGLALAGTDALVCRVNHGPLSLVRIPRAGGSPVVLASGPPERGVQQFVLAANGVLFTTDEDTQEQTELAFVPLDGSSAPVELSGAMIPTGDVQRFLAHPDGASTVYIANPELYAFHQLYRVPLDGSSAPLELTTPVHTSTTLGTVLEFAVTADKTRAVYRTDAEGGERAELLVAELAQPGVALELSGTDAVGRGLVPTLDSTRVLYRTEAGALRIVPLDGSAAPLMLDSTPGSLAPVLTQDGVHALYDAGNGLRKVALDGTGAPLELVVPPAGILRGIPTAIVLDRQGLNAFYQLDFQTQFFGPFRTYLWQAPLDGSAPARRLHPEIPETGGVWQFQVTPDGRHVVYSASHIDGSRRNLFEVDLSGNLTPRRINPDAHPLASFGAFDLSDDGRQVVLRGEQVLFSGHGLFGAPVGGKPRSTGTPPSSAGRAFVELTHLPSSRDVAETYFIANSEVVFLADAELDNRVEVFRNPIDAGRGRVRLSGTMTPGGDASALLLSDGGQWTVYIADQNTDSVSQLFAVPTAGGLAQSLFVLPQFRQVGGWIAEDGTGLLHVRVNLNSSGSYELISVPLDASAPGQIRNPPLVPNGDVETDFFPLGDGRLIFRADTAQYAEYQLYLTL